MLLVVLLELLLLLSGDFVRADPKFQGRNAVPPFRRAGSWDPQVAAGLFLEEKDIRGPHEG